MLVTMLLTMLMTLAMLALLAGAVPELFREQSAAALLVWAK